MEGQGTEINIFRTIQKITELREEKREDEKIWMLFIDFAKAYDTVNHEILFIKMKQLNIPEPIIQGI